MTPPDHRVKGLRPRQLLDLHGLRRHTRNGSFQVLFRRQRKLHPLLYLLIQRPIQTFRSRLFRSLLLSPNLRTQRP